MTKLKYQGLAATAVILQGSQGFQELKIPKGGALAIYSADTFTEEGHEDMAHLALLTEGGLVDGQPADLANVHPGHFDFAAKVANQLYEALANDGKLSASESAAIFAALSEDPKVQDAIGGLIKKVRGILGK